MVKALADRLAEAFAEKLHRDVRTTYWGYAKDEALETEDMLKIKYHVCGPSQHCELKIFFLISKRYLCQW